MDKRAYWIWLQHAFSAGSEKPWVIHNRFSGGVEEFYAGGARLWNSMQFITDREAQLLYHFTLQEAQALLEISEKLNHKVITPESEKYPEALRNIFDPPAVLYYRGEIPDVDGTPSISLVGTRKPDEAAKNAALTIGYQLALSGAVVVSGGALGIDTAAHKGALRGMGKTIAVLPCGLSNGYLVENHALREKIAQNGALITEYAMNAGVTRGVFQVRNRLISGLACATLVFGAGVKSGTLITAKHAKNQNRDVFVYAGDLKNPKAQGSQGLVRDGAKPVHHAEDILVEYENRFRAPVRRTLSEDSRIMKQERVSALADAGAQPHKLSVPAQTVIEALSEGERHFSEIVSLTALSAHTVLSALTELELLGLVHPRPGRKYQRMIRE